MPQHNIYNDDDFITAIKDEGKLSAAQIAKKVGCNSRIATIRLKRLVAENMINSEMVSGRWQFWF